MNSDNICRKQQHQPLPMTTAAFLHPCFTFCSSLFDFYITACTLLLALFSHGNPAPDVSVLLAQGRRASSLSIKQEKLVPKWALARNCLGGNGGTGGQLCEERGGGNKQGTTEEELKDEEGYAGIRSHRLTTSKNANTLL